MYISLFRVVPCVLLSIVTCRLIEPTRARWPANLIRFMESNFQAYQVVILVDQKELDKDNTLRLISRKLPTWKISLQNTGISKVSELNNVSSFSNLRDTSLFLMIGELNHTENLRSFNESISFLDRISGYKTRPKCLLVVPGEANFSPYDQFLRFLWSKKYIDVTILFFEDEKRVLDSANVMHFNPFTNTTSNELIPKERFPIFEWFPDKTRDLHGFKMKVGVYHTPPASYLKFNDRGEIEASGYEIEIMETIGQAMNFKIEWITSDYEEFGEVNCETGVAVGFIEDLKNNEINLVAVHAGRIGTCVEAFTEWSTDTVPFRFVMVVPIQPAENSELSLEWKFLNLICLTVILCVLWILGLYLKFDRQFWGILDILQIVIGMGTTNTPWKVVERIVFGFLLLICFFHSSYIYTAFTDVNLEKQSPAVLKTIDDVASSPLPLIFHEGLRQMFIEYAEGSSFHLLNRTRGHTESFESCLNILVVNKSIACLVMENVARVKIEQSRGSEGNPVMRIVDESFQKGSQALMMERNSPFVSRINKIIRILTQAGLIDKWRKDSFDMVKFEDDDFEEIEEEIESLPELVTTERIIMQITVFLFCAHVFSCLVFLCELLVFYIGRLR